MDETKNCGCGQPGGEHHNDHGDGCGCGQTHEAHQHDHHDGCGCGQAHEAYHHMHEDGCCCGHAHDGQEGADGPDYENGLTIAENNVLMALLERGALPVAQFALTSSKEPEAYAVALEPVYIADPADTLDAIKEYGRLFLDMEDKGLIAIGYDSPLAEYPYTEFRESGAFRHFVETAAEAKQRDFTFDTPNLELGSIALTARGRKMLDRMLGL